MRIIINCADCDATWVDGGVCTCTCEHGAWAMSFTPTEYYLVATAHLFGLILQCGVSIPCDISPVDLSHEANFIQGQFEARGVSTKELLWDCAPA